MDFQLQPVVFKIKDQLTPILMRITGHKKESTFLEYIGEKFNQDHYADLFLSQASNL